MIIGTPLGFTWGRVILAPLIPLFYFWPGWGAAVALVIYIVAALSDYYDGKLARKHNLSSAFGAFLDPVADKLLVIVALFTLLADPQPLFSRTALLILAALIILREVVQSALRDWMSQAGRSEEVAVTQMSKTKTLLQMIALGVLLGDKAAVQAFSWLDIVFDTRGWSGVVGMVMLGGAAVIGIITLGSFLKVAFGKSVS